MRPAPFLSPAQTGLTPLRDADFAGLMAAFSPFEAQPRIAVAVSGGGDSMALCLLADRWARQRGGHAVALTVDHGLRLESAAEASLVGTRLAGWGIRHVILTWRGEKPASGIQAAARAARYALLEAWCREAGILHLLLGHTRDDQQETVFLRLGSATGVEGAAGMSAVVERGGVRLLRPCLDSSRDSLRATLAAAGQDCVEDPSNADRRFARVRIRGALAPLPRQDKEILSGIGRDLGRGRLALEVATAAALARHCRLHPAGFALFDGVAWSRLPERLAVAVLNRLCTSVGGGAAPPRDAAVRAAAAKLQLGVGSTTLAGCRLLSAPSDLLVCREARHLPHPLILAAGQHVVWDRRFLVTVAGSAEPGRPLRLDYLGRTGWAEVVAEAPGLRRSVPPAVRPALPAIWDDHGVLRVPHLAYTAKNDRNGMAVIPQTAIMCRVVLAPALSLSGNGFRLAPAAVDTI